MNDVLDYWSCEISNHQHYQQCTKDRIITFEGVYDFMTVKSLARAGKHKQIYILAEGLIEGEGRLLTNRYAGNNPAMSEWGSTPMLIQSTHKPGTIKVKAEVLGYGVNSIESAELKLELLKPNMKFLYIDSETPTLEDDANYDLKSNQHNNSTIQKEREKINLQLKEVEKQQDLLGEPF